MAVDIEALHSVRSSRHSLQLVAAGFAFFGLLFGVWQVVLADLQRVLRQPVCNPAAMSPLADFQPQGIVMECVTCTRCPALVASRRRIVPGYGDREAGIVFVGEAPGQHGADRTGVPFSGDKSGARLQAILCTLGLAEAGAPLDAPRLRCFVTNTVRCCPPANRTPAPQEVANCAFWLQGELDSMQPWLVVPIGRVALQAIGLRYLGYDPGRIRPLHASVLQAATLAIVPCVHPSRISHAQVAAFVTVMRAMIARLE